MSTEVIRYALPEMLYVLPDELAEPEITNVRPGAGEPTEAELKELEELGRSIAKGQIQPVLVSRVDNPVEGAPKFNLIAGRRRKAAVAMYNMSLAEGVEPLRLLAAVTTDDTDERMFQQALHENLHRKNINPMQFALNIKTVKATFKPGTKPADARKRLAKFFMVSEAQIIQHESLLDLPEAVQQKVAAGELSKDDAFKLVKVAKKEGAAAAEKVAEEALAAEKQVLADAGVGGGEGAEGDAVSQPDAVTQEAQAAAAADTTTTAASKKGKKAAKAAKKAAKGAKSAVIDKAARQAGDTTQRSKKQLLEFFDGCQGPAYGYPDGAVYQFVEKLKEYAAGTTTERTLQKYFDAMVEKAPRGTAASVKKEEEKAAGATGKKSGASGAKTPKKKK